MTKKVFADLAIWMLGFGIVVGIIFPFLLLMLEFPEAEVIRPGFFAITLAAGVLLAMVNYLLVYGVVQPRLNLLVEHMQSTEGMIHNATRQQSWGHCDAKSCFVPQDSDDEIGATAAAFNQLVAELMRSRKLDNAASEFSHALSSKLDLDELNQHALDLLIEHTEAAAGAVFVEMQGELQVAANRGLERVESIAQSNHLLNALNSGEIRQLDLPKEVMVEGVLTSFRPSQILLIPVSFKQQSQGVVVLATGTAFPRDALWLLGLVRQGYGLALNNALTHSQLQHIAAIDPLTDVYNRRFGLARLHEEFGRSRRSGSPFGLCIFDIDHFKSVNDTYGHLSGDKVLAGVAEQAREALRSEDILIRYGGEEFLMVLPGAATSQVAEVGERIRKRIEEMRVENNGTSLSVTVSVGCSAYPDDQVEDEQTLIGHADEALYQAKAGGRNRVVRYRPATSSE
ncbi:sensor domain-containing diguanylate cyclase [endosymbiont of Riftia pachyptila]|uniref:diguanylate cyclase n=1 Tax=endosymbiont of Riftia pachyptila (vent Ph05) TaxID=1048808 RepID=G2DCY9_9GAMM|nr:GGDEF domain-containing protein [endosymbiont of Riftia pachyptila]EGV51519.1 diguanylate cyclase [endosymbiont of Riftia pachyptila (vent Ph05)]